MEHPGAGGIMELFHLVTSILIKSFGSEGIEAAQRDAQRFVADTS